MSFQVQSCSGRVGDKSCILLLVAELVVRKRIDVGETQCFGRKLQIAVVEEFCSGRKVQIVVDEEICFGRKVQIVVGESINNHQRTGIFCQRSKMNHQRSGIICQRSRWEQHPGIWRRYHHDVNKCRLYKLNNGSAADQIDHNDCAGGDQSTWWGD